MTDILIGGCDTLAGAAQPIPAPSLSGVVWGEPQSFACARDLVDAFPEFAPPADLGATPEQLGHIYVDLT